MIFFINHRIILKEKNTDFGFINNDRYNYISNAKKRIEIEVEDHVQIIIEDFHDLHKHVRME